jgi:hypothetical protein
VPQDHGLPGFYFNVEEWDAKGQALRDPSDLPLARLGGCRTRLAKFSMAVFDFALAKFA